MSAEEIERIAVAYREFKREGVREEVAGFCKVATLDEVRAHNYALTPGRYVGAEDVEDEDAPFEERFPQLVAKLEEQFMKAAELEVLIRENLQDLSVA